MLPKCSRHFLGLGLYIRRLCLPSPNASFQNSYALSFFKTAILIFVISFHSVMADEVSNVHNPLRDITVQLNWHHQFQFAGFHAAIQQGYYQQAGLNVTLKAWESGINPLQEVTSGNVDFGVGVSSLITDFAKGADIRLVMSAFQYSPLVLLAHHPFEDLSQFANKRIMHNGSIQIRMLLKQSGLSQKQMPKEVDSSGDLNDFISGKVDFYGAYTSNEPYRLEQLGINYNIVDPKNYGVQSYSGLVFTSEQISLRSPEMVNAFRDATIRGWKFALDNPQEVINFIVQNYVIKKDTSSLIKEANTLKRYVRLGHIPIGNIDHSKVLAILSAAQQLNLITTKEYDFARQNEIFFNSQSPLFTQEERHYLSTHNQIIVADSIDYAPFQFRQNRTSQGLVQDYLKAIEQVIGIHFVN